jgi:hypothetical protein
MTSKDWRPTAFVETAPGGVADEETEATSGDRRRALYELLRHLMTLDALALVLTATLVGRAFAQPLQRTSVGIAVIAFLVSLVAGTLTYLNLLADHPRAGAPLASTSDMRFFMWTGVVTVLGFVTGMVLLAVFFCANWFR